ncbi:FKBP-type peptidyl-prolyl cis-trans isomerase [bacterium]|nr:FKBP-type peptidyl-prolyl cis-trans isomerase [bacterium]
MSSTACKGGEEPASEAPAAKERATTTVVETPAPTPAPTATPEPTPEPTPQDVTTPGGVKVEFIEPGSDRILMPGDTVKVHYSGWLENGEKFDSSYDWGSPLEFRLGRGEVIKGWDEGIARLHVGSKAKLTIPADMAYGKRGMPPRIPPDATLTFEVEVLDAQ